MKKSENRTDLVLVEAGCCSEYDFCNLAIIKLTPELLNGIDSTLEYLKKVKEVNPNFSNATFFTNAVEFYADPDIDEDLLKDSPCYVELDEGEELAEISEYLDVVQLKVYHEGVFFFVGYGKYSNTEYYTETLNVKDYL